MSINTAFLVCAGLGTRMKPLTESLPKPLVVLNGRPILGYVFDHLRKTAVTNITVNTHHLPQHLSSYLKSVDGFHITESYEPVLLETGGGLVKALPSLGTKPFFMINGDAFWIDGKSGSTLTALEAHYDPARMDILLCLTPVTRMKLTAGVGDYDVMPDGRLVRSLIKHGTHMFTGIRILNPAIMSGFSADKFSFLKNMDEAEKQGRLYGYVMEGDWHHISTPEDLDAVAKSFKS
ncbi:MAG: nucleotidyltransferase family protein [Pseudobdellovibrionaceae bacterium]